MHAKKLALMIREMALDKKAEEPLVLDVAKLSNIGRYFLLTHGNSDRQVRAIAENIIDKMKEAGVPVWHVEGLEEGRWVLLDYGSVIAHIFHRATREFYALERLWGEAKRL
ncbi:MAG: ribosome silencing factor [Candidatus Omnitrophota bacterium]|jgi:ribosome-associated protein